MADYTNLGINGGGMRSRYLTNAYTNIAGIDSGSFGDNALFSFGSNNGLGLGGMINPMMGGMGMMGGMYGQDSSAYINYQKRMNTAGFEMQEDSDKYQIRRQISQQKLARQSQFATGASEGEITERIKVLKKCVEENEQVHVKEQYAKLIEAVKTMYPEQIYATNEEKMAYDTQIKAYANRLYASVAGQDLDSALEQSGDSQLVHGIKKGLDPFNFFTDNVSAKDNIAHVTDTGLSKTDISDRRTGKAVGYAGLALATAALVFALPFAAKGGGKGAGSLFKAWGKAWSNIGKTAATV